MVDNVSLIIILRALFIFKLIEKGWSIRKSKHGHNNFEMYKSVKRKYI